MEISQGWPSQLNKHRNWDLNPSPVKSQCSVFSGLVLGNAICTQLTPRWPAGPERHSMTTQEGDRSMENRADVSESLDFLRRFLSLALGWLNPNFYGSAQKCIIFKKLPRQFSAVRFEHSFSRFEKLVFTMFGANKYDTITSNFKGESNILTLHSINGQRRIHKRGSKIVHRNILSCQNYAYSN